MATTGETERATAAAEGLTINQVQNITRTLRETGRWARDRPGNGGSHASLRDLTSRLLSTTTFNLRQVESHLVGIENLRFGGCQHEPASIAPGTKVDEVLTALAVRDLVADDSVLQRIGFIRGGADLTLHQTVQHILDRIATNREIGPSLEDLGFGFQFLSLPQPFGARIVLWLDDEQRRLGWDFRDRAQTINSGNGENISSDGAIPRSVMVRTVTIPAAWFRVYARLWRTSRTYFEDTEAA